jgi:putative lipoic acid-binding regulatory protein
MSENEPIEFPCYFPLKSIGIDEDDYRQFVIDTVATFVEGVDAEAVRTLPSSGGKYLSVTVPFIAQSRKQLNEIYQALSNDPRTRYLI